MVTNRPSELPTSRPRPTMQGSSISLNSVDNLVRHRWWQWLFLLPLSGEPGFGAFFFVVVRATAYSYLITLLLYPVFQVFGGFDPTNPRMALVIGAVFVLCEEHGRLAYTKKSRSPLKGALRFALFISVLELAGGLVSINLPERSNFPGATVQPIVIVLIGQTIGTSLHFLCSVLIGRGVASGKRLVLAGLFIAVVALHTFT